MNEPGVGWIETYLDGSQFAEAELIRSFMADIHEVQARNKDTAHAPSFGRAFHAKIHAGIADAEFRISPNIPDNLKVEFLQPGKKYRARVRLSNASGVVQPDSKKDLRGVAIRVLTAD